MVYSKPAGKKRDKMDSLKMRNQLCDMVHQGGFKPSNLPEVVIEDNDYDKEPGGARLDGAPYNIDSNKNNDKNQNRDQGVTKTTSVLNPSSSPWVPTSPITHRQANEINHSEIAELDGTPKLNTSSDAYPLGNATSQISHHHRGQGLQLHNQYIAAIKDCVKDGHYVNQSTMNDSQFVSASSQQSHPIPMMAVYGQLSGSASMGNLDSLATAYQNNSDQCSQGGNEAANQYDVASPGSDTSKVLNANCLKTEPRDFAPRSTPSLARFGAPPKFNLENVSNGNGNGISATDAQDPFTIPNSQGGTVQQPFLGSQIDTTHLLANGHIPLPVLTGEAHNFDDHPRDSSAQSTQNSVQASQIPQIYISNGGLVMTEHTTKNMAAQGLAAHDLVAQGIPFQSVLETSALTSTRAGTYQPFAGNNAALVPYQVGYLPQGPVALYDAPIPDYIRAQRSVELNRLTAGATGLPTAQVALHEVNFPFVEPATRRAHHTIPFVTNRAEIIAVLGRNSRILNDMEEPVHIIMERITGKTTDAYVEFHTLEDASKAVEKYQQNIGRGRMTRIGQRPVDIELSSEAALMKDLFPSAKGVFWNGTNPQILPNNDQEPWGNFKGFVSNEEMTMLVKHVEVPHRSPFSKDCPQRPFECLISTLTKFPWHMKANVTVQQRYAIHKATCDLIRILVSSIQDKRDELNLTHRLLKRVVAAAMRCEGFSALQKDDVAYLVGMGEMEQRAFGQPRFAEAWRHLYVLVPKTGIPLDVIEWYIAIVREETVRFLETQSFQDKVQTRTVGNETDAYFGFFWRELNHPAGPDFDGITLSQLAMHEYQTLESIIRRALTPTHV
ncbi:hypothetical protein LZ31DRAFT_564953 [Colletotrichum somersetense]|nr:hypothetical protein LZ31DRAFT_564953 [Colletotrichum somersetense]